MGELATRRVGDSIASVTELGLGCAPLGDLFTVLSEEQAQRTLAAAWEAGVRYFDTSPFYGHGKSEHRVGHFLRQRPRSEFMVSTKVGRVFKAARDPANVVGDYFVGRLPFDFTYDYSYDGIMRSFEDSLQRLSLPSVDMLLIHDLDFWFHQKEAKVSAYLTQLVTSGWKALDELRSSGQIKAIGAGINEVGMIPRFLDLVGVDFFIVALVYTLLDQDVLDVEFPLCERHGAGAVIGAVFASGILATGPIEGATYRYEAAPPETLQKVKRMVDVCASHDVPLAAAAMQFPLAHPIVASIIPGALAPEHVTANAGLLNHPIPADLWSELKEEGLLREDAPTP
jgi:D-threo-aldose 1-dehydrogenase